MVTKKQNQRVKLTRQLLRNSLIELMGNKPIGKITIKEICENSDINRSTFYAHYTDQYALLCEIENELIEHVQEHLKKIDSNAGSVQYLEALLSYIEGHADIFRILLCKQENLSFQSVFIENSFFNLKLNLSLNCSESVASYVYNYLIMGCLSVIKQWIEADFDMSSKNLADLIFRLSDKAASVVY
ncbi:TetR family transcriptional regulator [Pullulanibacillus camelliae]|uniref:TetR family transcriptional regulator n=1 Tax=Pullulanibacillus camelliae TaxID=1707096 RepID=A0A8J2YFU4_9BACL|nr:TetR-like C-terminal domain-containing protein [Pullulanibacillus camelliae]GGE31603.1 TetR family transcriptional regulator [Pullulanibacillus camelliae]